MSDHATLAAALVEALADLPIVEAARTAKIPTKDGGKYEYQYADIGDVVKLTRPRLAAHGIVALTPVHEHGSGLACTVVLLHASGERLDLGPFPFPHGRDAQATGSMVTYHRRFALIAALGMAAGDDDDGASAVAAPPPEKAAITAANAKKGIIAKLEDAEIPDAVDHAAAIWRKRHGDSRSPLTQSQWDVLAADTDAHIDDLKALQPGEELT